jgi:hypothetical protein
LWRFLKALEEFVGIDSLSPNQNIKNRPSEGKLIGVAVGIVAVLVLIAIAVTFYLGENEPVVELQDDGIQIDALYGRKVAFSDITGISLVEKSMKEIGVGRRTDGYDGIGGTLRGHFQSDARGETLLFVQSQSSPTLWIECNTGEDVYLSFRDGTKTEQLYREVTAAYNSR